MFRSLSEAQSDIKDATSLRTPNQDRQVQSSHSPARNELTHISIVVMSLYDIRTSTGID